MGITEEVFTIVIDSAHMNYILEINFLPETANRFFL